MAPSGPNGDDDDDDPNRPPLPDDDDDDDDEDDDDVGAPPTFVFPNKNPDSTPVAFILDLDHASFAPEAVAQSIRRFKAIKL
jgi:hypothetical protein